MAFHLHCESRRVVVIFTRMQFTIGATRVIVPKSSNTRTKTWHVRSNSASSKLPVAPSGRSRDSTPPADVKKSSVEVRRVVDCVPSICVVSRRCNFLSVGSKLSSAKVLLSLGCGVVAMLFSKTIYRHFDIF